MCVMGPLCLAPQNGEIALSLQAPRWMLVKHMAAQVNVYSMVKLFLLPYFRGEVFWVGRGLSPLSVL